MYYLYINNFLYLEKHETYLGKRIKRGLYLSSQWNLINVDVNVVYNILKSNSQCIFKGDRGISSYSEKDYPFKLISMNFIEIKNYLLESNTFGQRQCKFDSCLLRKLVSCNLL